MTAKPYKQLLVNMTLAGAILLLFAYPLSYAPVVRLSGGVEPHDDVVFGLNYPDGSRFPIYSPIDWIIDRTSLRQPLFWWADRFGVRDDFQHSHLHRTNLNVDWVDLH